MRTKTKRTLSAWLLLSVFLSMMSLSILHRHEAMVHVAIDCAECAHHVHHGHLTAAADSIHECLLCQFISFSYIAAAAVIIAMPLVLTQATGFQQILFRSLYVGGYQSTRAPPYALIN